MTSSTTAAAAAAAADNPSSTGAVNQGLAFLGSVANWMRLPALASTGIAAVLTTLLYFKQKALIYPSEFPAGARSNVPRPSRFGFRDFEELVIPTRDGQKLSAFYIRGPRNRPPASATTILMFHGNAGNIGHRLPVASMIVKHTGCNVFMLEYRGYGLSTGEPGEAGINIDAQTALDYLRKRAETSSHKIILYGQSLGGAVAIKLAALNQQDARIAGMVLENTFLSMRKLIPSVLPPAKYFSLLCHQIWPSNSLIPSIKNMPMLFLSGLQDEIVPPHHMSELFKLATTENKTWKPLPHGDHNSSVVEDGYFDAFADFVRSVTI